MADLSSMLKWDGVSIFNVTTLICTPLLPCLALVLDWICVKIVCGRLDYWEVPGMVISDWIM